MEHDKLERTRDLFKTLWREVCSLLQIRDATLIHQGKDGLLSKQEMMDILKKAATNAEKIRTNSQFINQIQNMMSSQLYDVKELEQCNHTIEQHQEAHKKAYEEHLTDIQNARKLIELCKDFNKPTEVRFGLS